MKMKFGKFIVGLVSTVLAATCLGFAGGKSHKSERATSVEFANTMKFNNGDTLPAGSYRMEVAEGSQTPDVTFVHDGKTVATEKANVVPENVKNQETEIDSVAQGDAYLVRAIHPDGWNEELTFGPAGEGASH
jgi:hypothetical protein